MLNLLLLIDSLGSGGAQNQLTLLARGFQDHGHQVTVFYYFDDTFFLERLQTHGVKTIYEPKRDKVGWSVVSRLRRLYEQENYDATLSFLDTPNFYACLAARLAKHQPRIVVSYRSLTDFSALGLPGFWRRKWVNRQADTIITNAHHERLRWQKKIPAQADKWQTIYNLINVHPTEYSADQDRYRFVCVGRLEKRKNPEIILNALLLLRGEGHELPTIDWYGRHDHADENDRRFSAAFKRKISQNGLEAHFRIFDPVPDVRARFPLYRALIHPSVVEGLPNVICEALAEAIPVLTGKVLDHPILVADEERGFLFDVDQPQQLADAMRRIAMLDQTTYTAMRQKCHAYAANTFNQPKITQAFLDVLSPKSTD